MVATFSPSLLPLPSASRPSKDAPHVSTVGYAMAAARRLSNALPYQWQYSFDKEASLVDGFSKVDLSGALPQWVAEKKAEEVMPNQLCPGGFPIVPTGELDDEVRFDPLETIPSLLPSHRSTVRRPKSSSSSLSDLSDDPACHTADLLSLAPGSLLLDLHNCRDASKIGCVLSEVEVDAQYQQAQEVMFSVTSIHTASTSNSSDSKQLRRKSFPRRFLGTSLERAPRQLSLFKWDSLGMDSGPNTPELQAPGWKQVDYFAAPTATGVPSDDSDRSEAESDDDGACFTAAQLDQICQPFDRRPSNVAELDSIRPAGGVGLEGRARAMSHPW